jgi:diguanylate cyclase (GGDEF)-like protein
MAPIVKSWVNFLIPGGIVVLVAIGFLRPQGLPPWVQGPVHVFPIVVLGFGFFFGWYLSSSRLILSLLVMVLADRAIALFPPTGPDPVSTGHVVFTATTLLLPLNLLAISIINEQSISIRREAVRLSLVLIQPVLVFWLLLPEQADIARSLQAPLWPTLLSGWVTLPQLSLVAFSGALVLIGVRVIVQKNPLDSGTFWALVSAFVAFHGFQSGWSVTNFLATAGLILFLTLMQASHQRIYRDDLTGVLGRGAYEEAVANLGTKYALGVVGIDQLKQYAAQHGKSVGEQVLRLLAPKIVAAAGSGRVYRLVGEEFTVLFPKKTATEALARLEAIRKAVEQASLYLRGRDQVWEGRAAGDGALIVTVSIGLAEAGDNRSPIGPVTKAAYRALYAAKGEGGNLVKRETFEMDVLKSPAREVGRIVAYNEFEN